VAEMLNNLFVTMMALLDNFMFEPMNFVYNIKYMIIGMVCIIIVMGVLILITTALNKLVPKFAKKKDKDNK
jgi:Na+-transporting methylmalonyl-CoA/oxaloacetate decarboxylase gamma subunit